MVYIYNVFFKHHSPAHRFTRPAGNGSMVGAIVGSCKREPLVVGKPSDFMLDNIAKANNLQRSQVRVRRGVLRPAARAAVALGSDPPTSE